MPIQVENNTSDPVNSFISNVDAVYLFLIVLLVAVSRYLTRGALYYVDGPRIVESIHAHTYVIQPPGYWLFAHLGAMFHDPVFGLSFWNEVFSATGAAVFFLLCRKFLLPSRTALLAALAYGSVFFSWFAGDVHSSYASQILFAPLTVYCFLIYREKPSTLRLLSCAVSFAVGTGLRPSDGTFLAPLFIFMFFQFVKQWKDRIFLLVLTGILCLAWYVPTQMALHAVHKANLGNQLGSLAWQVSPLLA
ncbi:MAG: ArnT family glycosyltransferase, partial [Acidobacteriaceae bacterium]